MAMAAATTMRMRMRERMIDLECRSSLFSLVPPVSWLLSSCACGALWLVMPAYILSLSLSLTYYTVSSCVCITYIRTCTCSGTMYSLLLLYRIDKTQRSHVDKRVGTAARDAKARARVAWRVLGAGEASLVGVAEERARGCHVKGAWRRSGAHAKDHDDGHGRRAIERAHVSARVREHMASTCTV